MPDKDLRLSVLGPLHIDAGISSVEVTAPTQRRLLLLLVAHAGETMLRDRIIDALWPDETNDRSSALGFHVSELRRAVEGRSTDRQYRYITSQPGGYRLETDTVEIDAQRFLDQEAKARARLDSDPEGAIEVAAAALTLWRGDAYSDAMYDDFAQAERAQLDEARASAHETLAEAQLTLGRHADVLSDLEGLVREHPWREKLRSQLMVALYRSGRQGEALAVYQDAKRIFGEDLGIEPSSELTALEERILLSDPVLLTIPTRSTIPPPPTVATPTVGRSMLIDEVVASLDQNRFVTLTGLGGVGKTRVATEVAHRMSSPAWADLSNTRRSSDLALAVADSLVIDERVGQDRVAAIVQAIGTDTITLFLDCCERLRPAVSEFAAMMLRACPGLRIVTTSRFPLGSPGETVIPVMRLPDTSANDEPTSFDVFLDAVHRAGRAVSEAEIADARELSDRMEGIPLALEIAASQLRVRSARSVLDSLELPTPTDGEDVTDLPAPHAAMWAVIEATQDVLSPEATVLYRRVSVFDAIRIDDLACIADGDALPEERLEFALVELLDASLLERKPDDATILHMLDVVRNHATHHLRLAGEVEETRRQHAIHFADLVRRRYEDLIGPQQHEYLERFDANQGNFEKAMRWCLPNDGGLAINLAAGLGRYWTRRGQHEHARRTLREALDTYSGPPSAEQSQAAGTLAFLAFLAGDDASAMRWADEQDRIASSALAEAWAVVSTAQADFTRSGVEWVSGACVASTQRLEDALGLLHDGTSALTVYMLWVLGRQRILVDGSRPSHIMDRLETTADGTGHRVAIAAHHELVAMVKYFHDNPNPGLAARDLARGATILREDGLKYDLARVLSVQAFLHLADRDFEGASHAALEALTLAEWSGARSVEATALRVLGSVALSDGDLDLASERAQQAAVAVVRSSDRPGTMWTMALGSEIFDQRGDLERAVALTAVFNRMRTETGLAVPETFARRTDAALVEREKRLGPDAFAAAMARGASLSDGQAIGEITYGAVG